MKNYFSVMLFLFRERMERLLILLGILWTVSFAGFYTLGCMKIDRFGDGGGSLFLGTVFMLAFFDLTIHMSKIGEKKSRPAYTIWRLKISEKEIFFLESLVNTLCYLLLYLMEILVVVSLSAVFAKTTAFVQGPQGIMMSFYRYRFFHSLLPLKETGLWYRNIYYLFGMGIACAEEAVHLRDGKQNYLGLIAMYALFVSQFPKLLHEEDYLLPALFLILLGFNIWSALAAAYGEFGEAGKSDDEPDFEIAEQATEALSTEEEAHEE